MCGIVGYTGAKKAAPILIEGLTGLEYRGYDSSGVAVLNSGDISMKKAKGRLKNLFELTDGGKSLIGTTGIGHTRWATHGEPNDINSHPHLSGSGQFAVVHNGIIENYLEIREFLMQKGYVFRSQTDTETVVQLLDYYYNGNIFEAIEKTINKLTGSYALGILSVHENGKFYAVRKDSPLVIGLGEGENFIASDIPAVLKHTRRFILPEDKDVVVVTSSSVEIYDANRERVSREPYTVDWDIEAAAKDGYPHYMLKEIFEQPKALEQTMGTRLFGDAVRLEGEKYAKGDPDPNLKAKDGFRLTDGDLENLNKIFIIACGSSYHAGMIGKYFIESNCRIPVEIDLASEFRYRRPILDKHSLTIVISQSGETADTIAALREAKRLGSRTLGIVNVIGSTIAREADDVLYTFAGPEMAVATTKGYTTQVTVLQLLGLYIAERKGTIAAEKNARYLAEIASLPDIIRGILGNLTQLQQLAAEYFGGDKAFFIGRGMDYALSLEGALNLNEISYVHAECYAAGELKHGTISLIEENSLVIACATGSELFDKTLSNVKEVVSRGATVIALVTKNSSGMDKEAKHVITLPSLSDETVPCAAAVVLQLFSYYVAAQRGCDIDKPRNLAKAVTVE